MARLFVQFMHPGPEPWYGKDEAGICEWNTTKTHKRKCIRADIRCWDRDRGVETNPREMYFWGEWETASRYEMQPDLSAGMPRAIHELIRPQTGIRPKGGQNTDPFVFGDRFMYTICHQPSYPSLRNLEEGSIIAFGSRLRNGSETHFGLDTLFVVGRKNACLNKVGRSWSGLIRDESELYETLTISPLGEKDLEIKKGDQNLPVRIYAASMSDDRTTDLPIFSFVPCSDNPFVRPSLETLSSTAEAVVSDRLTQGIKRSTLTTLEDSAALWEKIVSDLSRKGLKLGTRIFLGKD
jgi:hypothetical protein